MADAPHPLYVLAQQADARYRETVRSRTGHDCWALTAAELIAHPEIRAAYAAKVAADDAWLAYMRYDSERRSSARRGAIGDDR